MIDMVGLVNLVVEDVNGCVISNFVDFINFVVIVLIIDVVDGFCIGNFVMLMVIFGYVEYLWLNIEEIVEIIVIDGGVYEFDVVDVNGCVFEVVIVIDEYVLLMLNIGGFLIFCIGNSIILNVGV